MSSFEDISRPYAAPTSTPTAAQPFVPPSGNASRAPVRYTPGQGSNAQMISPQFYTMSISRTITYYMDQTAVELG